MKTRMKKSKNVLLAITAAATVMSLTGCGATPKLAQDVYTVELGSEMSTDPADYIKVDGANDKNTAEILKKVVVDVSSVDTESIGEYEGSATYNNKTFKFKVNVKDTVAPVGDIVNEWANVATGTEVSAADFVSGVEDKTDVSVQFVKNSLTEHVEEANPEVNTDETSDETAPETDEANAEAIPEDKADKALESEDGVVDSNETTISEDGESASDELLDVMTFDTAGDFDITIRLTDTSGNSMDLVQKMHVTVPDTTAPEIKGTKNISINVGNTPDYMKGVIAEDDVDGDLTESISVDSSQVDTKKAGTYKVVYTCADTAGNTATKEITVTVTAKKKAESKPKKSTSTTIGEETRTPETPSNSGNSSGSGGSGSSGGSSSGGGSNSGGNSGSNGGSSGSSGGSGNSGSGNSGGSSGGNTSSGGDSGTSGGNSGGGDAGSNAGGGSSSTPSDGGDNWIADMPDAPAHLPPDFEGVFGPLD